MLKSEAYQQIERIAQERGVSMDRVAAHLGMHNWELDQIIAHSISALAWAKITSAIQALSPLKVLSRGYTVTSVNGKAVSDPSVLREGDTLETRFAHGIVHSAVTDVQLP